MAGEVGIFGALVQTLLLTGQGLGKVVSMLVTRNITRTLGKKIGTRVRLSPVVMESTHDLDFAFWCLEPRPEGPPAKAHAWAVRSRCSLTR